MKPAYVLLATAAIFASAACNAEKGTSATNTDAPIKAVAAPKGGDWTKMVSATPEGGFVMGNPEADVKLIEYGSLTCPHCAEFAEKGAPQLIAKYVKTGRVSYEFRHFLRDGLDMSLSLVARCGGPERYFALSEGIFKDQREFFERAQSATPEQQQQLSTSPAGFAQLAGIQQWAAQRGVPSAKSNACLADQGAMDRLMQTSNDVTTQFPTFSGTPSFVVNGKMLEKTATWELLEPQLREALGS